MPTLFLFDSWQRYKIKLPFNTLINIRYNVIFLQDFAETAMNELLGWYGYSNVDRNDLTKSSRFPTTTVHLEADLASSTGANTHHARQMRLLNTTATATAAPSSRTTNSTPDRCNNSTSPESSGRHSKSPSVTAITIATKLNDKLGLL